MNELTIPVHYKSTRTSVQALNFINSIRNEPIIACDFEVAVKYTEKQREEWKELLETGGLTRVERASIESKLNATALDHPSHSTITHCSIAWSDREAFVFILDNKAITSVVLKYLTSTDQKQLWHNLSYDGRQLIHHTGKFPKNFEDTQILAKTLRNHVDTYNARTGLKELAGQWYGDWGLADDEFDKANMYEEWFIRYAATDACATFKVWEYMQDVCDKLDGDDND